MRVPVVVLFCLLILLGPAAAEDEKKNEPKKPANEMTEAERDAALTEAKALDAKVLAHYKKAEYDDAIDLARQALSLREKVLGRDHPDLVPSLNTVAVLLQTTGAYGAARPIYERTLSILEKELGPNHPVVAKIVNNLAILLQTIGAYDEARTGFERALKIKQKTLGKDHPDVAMSLNNLAVLLQAMGEFREALSLFQKALAAWEKTLPPDDPRIGSCLDSLAALHNTLGNYKQADELYKRALAILEKALGPGHPDVASTLVGMGQLHLSLGEHEQARPLFTRATKIREAALGPDHPSVATSLASVAVTLYEQGAYEKARPLYERALAIRKKALGPDHPDVAISYHNIAVLLMQQGAEAEARPLLERALVIREKALGPAHPELARSLDALSLLRTLKGEHDEARRLSERAAAVWEKALGPDHPNLAASLNNLALLLQAVGEPTKARPLLERALELREKALGRMHPYVAHSLNSLAVLLDNAGRLAEARSLYERALDVNEKNLGPSHPSVAACLHNLARLRNKQGEHETAAALMERCLAGAEEHVRRALTGLQASQRMALSRSLRQYLHTALDIEKKLRRSGETLVLRVKGLIARVEAAERRLARAAGASTAADVRALRAAERRLAKVANSPPSFLHKENRAKWQEAYAEAASTRERLALRLARDFASVSHGLERLDLKVHDIQSALGESAVLIDCMRSGDHYIAWVIPPRGAVTRVDLAGASAIDADASALAERASDTAATDWQAAGARLRAAFFEPLAKHIPKGTKTIHFCPDAALAAIPLAVIPSADGTSFLGVEYTIANVSMAQDLVPWAAAAKRGSGALLVGGVDYGKAAAAVPGTTTRAFVDRAPRGGSYPYLSGTKQEVLAIGPALGKDTVTILGPDATESAVRANSKGKRVLHFATHGFVRGNLMRGLIRRRDDKRWLGAAMERQLAAGHDPLNLCGLAMAGANTRKGGGDDDGILTALEVSHLDLDGVGIVVLSACETALGTSASGEGVIGLVRGFQMAGANQVIGSLWKVDDGSTRALMVKFYELWSPKDGKKALGAAAALKKAQEYVRTYKDKDGEAIWKHPYYWAAWVLWGLPD